MILRRNSLFNGLLFLTIALAMCLLATSVLAGSLDPAFGTGGKVTTDVFHQDFPIRVFVQADGKILVAGGTLNFAEFNSMLTRYNSDGSLDTAFGSGGKVHDTTVLRVCDALLQPDGRILVLGSLNPTLQNSSGDDFGLLRFNSDGTRDNGFGIGGLVTTAFGGPFDIAAAVELLPVGKILVTGRSVGNTSTAGTIDLVQYNADGSPDNTFGTGGVLYYFIGAVNTTPRVYDILLLGSGRFIVLTGDYAVRFNPDGSFDNTFGTNGIAAGGGEHFAMQADGKFIVLPVVTAANFDGFNMTRRNADWTVDTGFGTNGSVKTQFRAPVGNYMGGANEVAVKPNGEIYVTGWVGTNDGNTRFFGLVRYASNGAELAKTADSLGVNASGNSIAIQSDGKIVAAGSTTSDLVVARYTDIVNDAQFTYRRTYDFNGDGLDDIMVYRAGSGAGASVWYATYATTPFYAFGSAGDIIAPADYTGDGVADLAVFRPSNGYWYIANSLVNAGTNFTSIQWGTAGDIPVTGDYDNDGKSDIAVFRPSNGGWYIRYSSDGSFHGIQWGATGDKPVVGDFDGDGKCDVAVYRPASGAWYILKSSDGQMVSYAFGTAGDVPVAADYDGDHKADIAVFRPSDGYWYRLNSSDGNFAAIPWGTNGDVPAPGDYDGDGKTDLAVYRGAGGTGNWYIRRSSNGSLQSQQWGAATDTPIPGN